MHPNIACPSHLIFEYLPSISFRSEEEKEKICSKGREIFNQGRIPSEHLQMGKKYKNKIESDYAPRVSIRWINEEVGHGAFAEAPIKAGRYVGEYVGIVRENTRYFVPISNYCYEYPIPDSIGRNFVIDAEKGNFTRFINHSSKPNVKPVYAFLDGFYHVIFISLRDISKGEQFCYDYGPSYWYIRPSPQNLSH